MDTVSIKNEIEKTLEIKHRRKPLSTIFPRLLPFIVHVHCLKKRYKNRTVRIAKKRSTVFLPWITARHASPLRRRLGTSDMRLQEQKIINLKQAISALNGVIINPGETFSLWELLGKPTKKRGYVDGMLLARGQVIEGAGGGLCQLGNLLHFLFLHTPLTVTERYHHSMDVFPDSARTIPFASGATVMYNMIDLQIKNNTTQVFQLKLWLTETQLKGHLFCDIQLPEKFHVYEKEHMFILHQNSWYRRNQLWREKLVDGIKINDEYLYTTIAPVSYKVTPEYLEKHNYISVFL